MKTDNTNRLSDPENLYIPGFEGILKKKLKKISRQVAAILIIGGKLEMPRNGCVLNKIGLIMILAADRD